MIRPLNPCSHIGYIEIFIPWTVSERGWNLVEPFMQASAIRVVQSSGKCVRDRPVAVAGRDFQAQASEGLQAAFLGSDKEQTKNKRCHSPQLAAACMAIVVV